VVVYLIFSSSFVCFVFFVAKVLSLGDP